MEITKYSQIKLQFWENTLIFFKEHWLESVNQYIWREVLHNKHYLTGFFILTETCLSLCQNNVALCKFPQTLISSSFVPLACVTLNYLAFFIHTIILSYICKFCLSARLHHPPTAFAFLLNVFYLISNFDYKNPLYIYFVRINI